MEKEVADANVMWLEEEEEKEVVEELKEEDKKVEVSVM